MFTRRNTIKGLAYLGFANTIRAQVSEDEQLSLEELLNMPSLTEVQGSEPGISETISVPASDIGKASQPTRELDEKKSAKDVALRMLEISLDHAGKVARDKNSEQVLEYLGLFGFTDVNTAYCACGVSYAASRAFCDLNPTVAYTPERFGNYPARLKVFKQRMQEVRRYYFMPSPLVRVIKADAQARGTWVPRTDKPEPGWLIIFSWNGRTPNHIGIIEGGDSDFVHTVEYNTSVVVAGDQRNGGVVARKKRDRDDKILGYVKLY
jgi:hypothetical protein